MSATNSTGRANHSLLMTSPSRVEIVGCSRYKGTANSPRSGSPALFSSRRKPSTHQPWDSQDVPSFLYSSGNGIGRGARCCGFKTTDSAYLAGNYPWRAGDSCLMPGYDDTSSPARGNHQPFSFISARHIWLGFIPSQIWFPVSLKPKTTASIVDSSAGYSFVVIRPVSLNSVICTSPSKGMPGSDTK